MQNLPTYTAQEEIQPAPVMDNSAGWTSAASAFGKVENVAENAYIEHERTVEEQKKLALDADKQMATTTLADEMEKNRLSSSLSSPDPVVQKQVYNTTTDAFGSTFIQNVIPQNRSYVQKMFGEIKLETNKQQDNQIIAQQDGTNYIGAMDGMQKNEQFASNAAATGNEGLASSAYNNAIGYADSARKANIIKPNEFIAYKDRLQTGMTKQSLLAPLPDVYRKLGEDGAKQYIQNNIVDGQNGLSDKDRENTRSQAQAILNLQKTSKDTIDGRVKLNADIALDNAKNGFQVNEHDVMIHNAMYPQDAAAYTQKLNQYQQSAFDASEIKTLPFTQQNDALQKLTKTRNAEQFINTQKLVKEDNDLWEKDPYTAANNMPSVQSAVQAYKQAVIGISQTGASLDPSKVLPADPTQANLDAQAAKGILSTKRMAISQPEAIQLNNQLSTEDADGIRKTFNDLARDKGANASLALQNAIDVKGSNIDRGMSFAVTLNPNDPSTYNSIKILQTPPQYWKHMPTPAENAEIDKKVRSSLSSGLPMWDSNQLDYLAEYSNGLKGILDPQAYAEKMESARDFLTKYSTAVYGLGRTSSIDDAVNMAAQPFNQFNYPNINGVKVMMPKEYKGKVVDEDAVKTYAKYAEDNLLPKFDYAVPVGTVADPRMIPSSTIDDKQRKEIYTENYIKGGHWISNKQLTGMNYVDAVGNPVVDAKTGENFGFKYNEIYNIKSTPTVRNKQQLYPGIYAPGNNTFTSDGK